MLGFKIEFKDTTIFASVTENEGLHIINSYVNKGTHKSHILRVGSLISFEHIAWCEDCVDNIDKITVQVVDVTQNSPIIKREHQDRVELLKEYYELKKELEKKDCYE